MIHKYTTHQLSSWWVLRHRRSAAAIQQAKLEPMRTVSALKNTVFGCALRCFERRLQHYAHKHCVRRLCEPEGDGAPSNETCANRLMCSRSCGTSRSSKSAWRSCMTPSFVLLQILKCIFNLCSSNLRSFTAHDEVRYAKFIFDRLLSSHQFKELIFVDGVGAPSDLDC